MTTKEYTKPLPEIDPDSQPFWDAAKKHELVVHKCRNCGSYIPAVFPPTGCPSCGDSYLEWAKVSGKGRVHTFVIFHMLYDPAFKEELPYNVAVIELAEGPFITSNVVQCRNEDIKIGMPVDVVFEDVTPDVSLPKFKPA